MYVHTSPRVSNGLRSDPGSSVLVCARPRNRCVLVCDLTLNRCVSGGGRGLGSGPPHPAAGGGPGALRGAAGHRHHQAGRGLPLGRRVRAVRTAGRLPSRPHTLTVSLTTKLARLIPDSPVRAGAGSLCG